MGTLRIAVGVLVVVMGMVLPAFAQRQGQGTMSADSDDPVIIDMRGVDTVGIQVTSTDWTGDTVTIQGCVGEENISNCVWFDLPAYNVVTGTSAETITADSRVQIVNFGLRAVRVDPTTVDGSPTITVRSYKGHFGLASISATVNGADGAIIDGNSSVAADVFDLTNSNPLATQIVDANGDAITSFGGGTQYAVDAALGATPTGTLAVGIRDDALSALTPVEGDAIGLRVDANGALWVIPSGTTAVSGTVTANLSATDNAVLDDIADGIPVTNAGTFATQAAQSGTWTVQPGNTANTTPWLTSISQGGNTAVVNASGQLSITCANCSGSGASSVDDAAFTVASDSGAVAMGLFDDTTPDSVDEGDAGGIRMSANRNMYVQIRDAAGNERGLNVDANGAIAVTGSFSVGIADDADFTAGTTTFSPVGGFYQSTVTACTDGDACAAGITTGRAVKVALSNADGSLVTYQTDAAEDSAAGTTGPQVMLRAKDFDGAALPGAVSAEGDAVTAAASLSGIQYVMLTGEDGSTQYGTSTTPLVVDLGANNDVTVTGDALTALQLIDNVVGVEDAAETAGGGLAMAGAVVRSTASGSSATAGDNATLNVDTLGRQWVRDGNPCMDHARITTVAINTASSGNVELVALNGSDLIYVCGYSVVAGAATGVQFIYGTGTACATGETDLTGVWSFAANGGITQANGGAPQFVVPAGNAFCVENSGANSIQGHVTYVRTAAP